MHRHRRSLWTCLLPSIALSACAGLSIIIGCTALFSAFTLYLMDSMEFNGFFARFSLAAGSTLGGYICGRFRRRRGLAEGILCGAVMYAVIAIAGLAAAGTLPGIKKLLLLIVCGAAGGVTGVNSKRPKGLRSD